MKEIPKPTVHMNGTGGKTLFAEYCKAADKVQDAIDAMHGATLNGRDYYPQGPAAFEVARDHRISMIDRMNSVFEELIGIAESIDGQMK